MKLTALAAVAVLALAGCGGAPKATPPKPFNLSGTMTLRTTSLGGVMPEEVAAGTPCYGTGGYSDITSGAQVVVSDENGKTVGLGSISGGKYDNTAVSCIFSLAVVGVPPKRSFYQVEVSHRGQIQYSEVKLRQPLDLTLGDGT